MSARVIKPYSAKYPDPIQLRAGDRVTLGARDQEWPGWIWATAPDGRSGWVPEHFLRVSGDEGEALRDYSALELSVEEGEIVRVVENVLGWALVESDGGRRGWVPLGHLAGGISPFDIPL